MRKVLLPFDSPLLFSLLPPFRHGFGNLSFNVFLRSPPQCRVILCVVRMNEVMITVAFRTHVVALGENERGRRDRVVKLTNDATAV
jgi:hypothetical protein